MVRLQKQTQDKLTKLKKDLGLRSIDDLVSLLLVPTEYASHPVVLAQKGFKFKREIQKTYTIQQTTGITHAPEIT